MNLQKWYSVKFLFVISVLSLHAQSGAADPTNYILTNLISGSPKVEAMAKYGDYTVNHHTGMASISIPIYKYKGTHLTLPISLDYQYGGFRPSEKASWVGTGWNLNLGGVIRREIRDKVDDTLPAGQNYTDIESYLTDILYVGDNDFLKKIVNPVSNVDLMDSEVDIYHYSFPGYSGKFVLVGTDIYPIPNNRFKFSGDPETGFTITDDAGVVYTYGEPEITHQSRPDQGVPYQMPDYNSAFHLTSIAHPAGESIVFTYANEGTINQQAVKVQSMYKQLNYDPEANIGDQIQGMKHIFKTQILDTRRLLSVQTPLATLEFISTHKRKDIDGNQYALSEIKIKNNHNTQVRAFAFHYDYFENLNNGPSNHYLKLTSFTEGDRIHEFKYYNEFSSFPNAITAGTDHFGYYRGIVSASNLIPSNFENQVLGGANGVDKTPDLNFARYGAIQKITYPTKGSLEFAYEPNYYTNERFIPTGVAVQKSLSYLYEKPDHNKGRDISEYIPFTVTHDQTVTITVLRDLIGPLTNSASELEIYTNDLDNHTLGTLIYQNLYGPSQSLMSTTFDSDTHFLTRGNYVALLRCDAEENSVRLTLDMKSETPDEEGFMGPGIRIKKITSIPLKGTNIVKEYDYTDEFGYSTGILPASATPSRPMSYMIGVNLGTTSVDYHLSSGLQLSSSLSSSYSSGLQLFYRNVHERVKSTAGDLLTSYQYEMFEDGEINGINPKPKKTITHLNDQDFFVTKKVTEYDYEVLPNQVLTSIKPYLERIFSGAGSPPDGIFELYGYKNYNVNSKSVHLKEERVREFYNGKEIQTIKTFHTNPTLLYPYEESVVQSDGSASKTCYKYVEEYSLFSDLKTKNILRYPVDELRQVDDLIIQGVITELNTNGQPIAYHFLETDSATYKVNMPWTADQLIRNTSYKKRIQIDYSGWNIFQQVKGSDSGSSSWRRSTHSDLNYEVLIWGYNETLPIARVINMSLEEISSFLTEISDSKDKSDLDDDTCIVDESCSEEDLRASLNLLRNAINASHPKAEVYSYTYDQLVGITSESDPNGKLKFYKYDNLNRLKSVVDESGNILQAFDYQYKSE